MSDADSARIARRTVAAATLTVVGLALVSVVVWTQRPQGAPIEVSQQTTYIIQPTRADGWVDYPEAVDWMRRASLDAGGANAAEPLVRALGIAVLPTGVDRSALLRKLGIKDPGAGAPALTPLRELTPGDPAATPPSPAAVADWLAARCRSGSRGAVSLARIKQWSADAEAPLANLRTASEAKSVYVPVSRAAAGDDDFHRVDVNRVADAADALRCGAALKLLQKNAAASWRDVDALWKLGLLLARSSTPDEFAAASLFWSRALSGTVDLAASAAATPELLAAMGAGLGALPKFPSATEALMIHRLEVLDQFGTALVLPSKPGAARDVPVALVADAGAALARLNQRFDGLDAALQIADPAQRIERVRAIAAAATTPTDRGGPLGDIGRWLAPARALPSADQIAWAMETLGPRLLRAEIKAVASQRMALIALAVGRSQREKSAFPGSLDGLDGLPKDPCNGAAFKYGSDGTKFRLYSVGEDGRDDGGSSETDIAVQGGEPPATAQPL